jgi:hypothetical protein
MKSFIFCFFLFVFIVNGDNQWLLDIIKSGKNESKLIENHSLKFVSNAIQKLEKGDKIFINPYSFLKVITTPKKLEEIFDYNIVSIYKNILIENPKKTSEEVLILQTFNTKKEYIELNLYSFQIGNRGISNGTESLIINAKKINCVIIVLQ